MKIVINDSYGGFGLSHEAMTRYCELKGLIIYPEPMAKFADIDQVYLYWTVPEEERICLPDVLDEKGEDIADEEYDELVERASSQSISDYDILRDDPALIQVVEKMGEDSWGIFAKLKIIDIPDDVKWHIAENGGFEWIAENHRTWP